MQENNENNENKTTMNFRPTEPVIVSGKYFGIKLLSVYDFILCIKMMDELVAKFISCGFEEMLSSRICEQACVVALCLYDSQSRRIFKSGQEVLQNFTPHELHFVYNEYVRLLEKVLKRDKIVRGIVEGVKKYKYKKMAKNFNKNYSEFEKYRKQSIDF